MRKGTKFGSIFGAVTMGVVLTACGGDADAESKSSSVPKSLVGEWYQSNKLDNGVVMQASVSSNDTIQVNMRTEDSSSIYWLGSFKSGKNPRATFNVTSKGDQDAMAMSIFGSQDGSKRFKYKKGDLSFDFTMLGTTSTVHLRQPSASKARSPMPTRTVSVPDGKIPSQQKTVKPVKPAAPKAPAAKVPAAPAVKAPSFVKR